MKARTINDYVRVYGPLGNSTKQIGDHNKETLVKMLNGELRWEWADEINDCEHDWNEGYLSRICRKCGKYQAT